MAVTTQYSTQYGGVGDTPSVASIPPSSDVGCKKAYWFDHVQSGAGDATSTVDLVLLPAGKYRILLAESQIEWTAFGAARTLDIGHPAYTNSDGTAVAASLALYDDDVDVSSAGQAAIGSDYVTATLAKKAKGHYIDSLNGVTIRATVAGGTIPDLAELHGYLTIMGA